MTDYQVDVDLDNELNNGNSGFTEWYAVLCNRADGLGVFVSDKAAETCYVSGLSPNQALPEATFGGGPC